MIFSICTIWISNIVIDDNKLYWLSALVILIFEKFWYICIYIYFVFVLRRLKSLDINHRIFDKSWWQDPLTVLINFMEETLPSFSLVFVFVLCYTNEFYLSLCCSSKKNLFLFVFCIMLHKWTTVLGKTMINPVWQEK